MQQLNELNAIVGECNRVVDGMLNGKMSRDDGLFAAAATLRNLAIEFAQFVTYALPILHTIDQAMRTAQAQAAQAPPTAAPTQGAPAAESDPAPSNVVPINAGTSAEIQKVDGTPGVRR